MNQKPTPIYQLPPAKITRAFYRAINKADDPRTLHILHELAWETREVLDDFITGIGMQLYLWVGLKLDEPKMAVKFGKDIPITFAEVFQLENGTQNKPKHHFLYHHPLSAVVRALHSTINETNEENALRALNKITWNLHSSLDHGLSRGIGTELNKWVKLKLNEPRLGDKYGDQILKSYSEIFN